MDSEILVVRLRGGLKIVRDGFRFPRGKMQKGWMQKKYFLFFLGGGGMGRVFMGWCLDDSNPVLPPAGSTSQVCLLFVSTAN